MTVRTTKDRLEKRGEIYLDAELDFKDEKNFAVVITKAGAAKLKEAGIDDPAAHFKDKKIRDRRRQGGGQGAAYRDRRRQTDRDREGIVFPSAS